MGPVSRVEVAAVTARIAWEHRPGGEIDQELRSQYDGPDPNEETTNG